jgi:protoporphyrin/coproporphyrin ferrochelatase
MAESMPRIGVVVFQLGGPDNLEAIQPFLFNLFCDPDIIDFPGAKLGRKPLAKLISTTRARKVRSRYLIMGGGSPIRHFTEQQARALERRLRDSGIDARCFVAMRYWHPFTAEAVRELRASQCGEVVLLPLYPQFSTATTGSSLNEWRRHFSDDVPVHLVQKFYENEYYLKAQVEKVEDALARFARPQDVEIVFSAHSVPVQVIEAGDPYQRQIEHSVELVMERGGWNNRHHLCYQSKFGGSKWLQPSLHATLQQLAARKVHGVCVVPISFVSDHVETLCEIDHEAREHARSLGIEQFEMTAGLNNSPTFIRALADVVRNTLGLERFAPDRQVLSEQTEIAAD